MKESLFLLAALLLDIGAAYYVEPMNIKRQLFGNTNGPLVQGKIFKPLKPDYDPQATRGIMMWGPYVLPASNAKHSGIGIANGIKLDPNSDLVGGPISPPCSNCTVLKAVANWAYSDGKQADVGTGVYTHHIIMSQTGRQQLLPPTIAQRCPGGEGLGSLFGALGAKGSTPKAMAGHGHSKRQFSSTQSPSRSSSVFLGGGGSAGSGSNFAPRNTSVASGVFVSSVDKFSFTSEIVNYDPKQKDLYLIMDVEWVSGKTNGLMDVGMGALSTDTCSAASGGKLDPPKDRAASYKGNEYTMTSEGYFVNITPHLHDGGINIKLFLNGKEVCESRALYGADGGSATVGGRKWETISSYTPCENAIAFKKNDKVYMTAEYDLSKHILRPDSANHEMGAEAMALATFIWAKKN